MHWPRMLLGGNGNRSLCRNASDVGKQQQNPDLNHLKVLLLNPQVFASDAAMETLLSFFVCFLYSLLFLYLTR